MALRTLAEYTNTRKPHDIAIRPFHRIESPHYDSAVDVRDPDDPSRPPPLGIADGVARRSGARNEEDFVESGLTKKIAKAVVDGLDTLLKVIPGVGLIVGILEAVNEAVKKFTDKDLIAEAKEELAKAIAKAFESALFDRFMRVVPAWVPVGREKYDAGNFKYPGANDTLRDADKEEEREVEGQLTASYQAWNDVPQTQWTRYSRWHFHVRPLAGYRKVIGRGNIPILQEDQFINSESQLGTDRFKPVLDIYGQHTPQDDPFDTSNEPRPDPNDRGAIECLLDVGAISLPPADGGSHGVMFDRNWPHWPMTGDHFWAAGRWAYDCARAGKPLGQEKQKDELHPTQLHPLKALAVARYEGVKFTENPGLVRAVRFFFLASSEGGYVNFRDETDRDGKTHTGPIKLRDRDYRFIVDLPTLDDVASPHPLGQTTRFMRNTIVIRPRLLMAIRFAPFHGPDRSTPAWADNVKFHELLPKVELIRPVNPEKAPTQALVTVPMTKLPAPSDPSRPEVYAFDLSLGWHDPAEAERDKLQQVSFNFLEIKFMEDHAPLRIKTCINGRWRVRSTGPVDEDDKPVPLGHAETMSLPLDARMGATIHGTIRHGFGEFIEETRLADRLLRVGGIFDVKKELEEKLKQAKTAAEKAGIKANIEIVDDLLDGMDDLIGQRFTPDWISDIDARRETDDKAEQNRISAIARELWVRPAPVVNRHDEPIGWVEGVPDDQPPGLNGVRGQVIPAWFLVTTPERLIKHLIATKGERLPNQANQRDIIFDGNRFAQVGTGNNLAQQINNLKGVFEDTAQFEYRAFLRVSVPSLP